MLEEARRLLARGNAQGALALLRRLRRAHPEDVEVQLAGAEAAAAAGHKELARSALLDAVGLWRPPEGPEPLRLLAVVEALAPFPAWHTDPVDWRIGQGLLEMWRLYPDDSALAAGLGRFLWYLEGEAHGLRRPPHPYSLLNAALAGGTPDLRTRWCWLLCALHDLDLALHEWPRGLLPTELLPAGATAAAALAAVRRALAEGEALGARLGGGRELREVLRRLRTYEDELLHLNPAPDRGSPAY